MPGVRWASFHTYLDRLIVAVDPELCDTNSLLEHAKAAEAMHKNDRSSAYRPPYTHPADPEPLGRTSIELLVDMLGVTLGLALRLGRVPRPRIEIDFAALLASFEGIPSARALLERHIGSANTDLALGLASSFNQALMQAWLAPAADSLRRYLRLREMLARLFVWEGLEPTLCSDPQRFPPPPPPAKPRPRAIPSGPIERYSERAVPATLGGLGIGVSSTQSLASASVALFGGIPKPATIGREAFVAQLGRRIAESDGLLLAPEQLTLLDRIDTVVIAHELLQPQRQRSNGRWITTDVHPHAQTLVQKIHRTGMQLFVVGSDATVVKWARPRAVFDGNAASHVQALQEEGAVVLYVSCGADAAYPAADLSLGVHTPTDPPWGAHLWLGSLALASLVVDASTAARKTSREGVWLAMADVAASTVVAVGGLRTRTTRKVMSLTSVVSLVSILNGWRHAESLAPVRVLSPQVTIPWHALSADEALRELKSRPEGLAEWEALQRARPKEAVPSLARRYLRTFMEELSTPLTPVLGMGAGLSALLGSIVDSALIATVLAVNAATGAQQRMRIERTVAMLQEDLRHPARVRRGGSSRRALADDLVVGDIVELAAGDPVPADCRILDQHGLEVVESALTGESLPVAKDVEATPDASVPERRCMLYAGTHIAAGSAHAVVVAVGDDTEARRGLYDAAPSRQSGVEARLEHLTAATLPFSALSGGLAMLSSAARKRHFREVLNIGVSMTVAAVPEGLPVLATLAQLAAAERLATRGVLVRNARAIETLGRVQVVCADKTGTLTEGKIALQVVSDGRSLQTLQQLDDAHRKIVAIGRRASPSSKERLPHTTDQALLAAAKACNIASSYGRAHWRRLRELPFESTRGYHAATGDWQGGLLLSVKGAPEVLLPCCTQWQRDGDVVELNEEARGALYEQTAMLAKRGLRVLAVAEGPTERREIIPEGALFGLTFHGFLAFADPVRASAKAAVQALQRAGVAVVMVTGDHPSTAQAIAAELGLPFARAITGGELEGMASEELAARVRDTAVFARVTPTQKTTIVQALQRAGKTVAMTGDGANDAAAILLADVGIAVGRGAASAARQAADLIVTDERIETIIDAVLEGRALWSSVRDAVAILLGGNLGETAFVALASLAAASPLNARQLLLVNLLTDALPALTIAVRPPRTTTPEQLLDEGPDASLGRALQRDMAWRAVLSGGAALAAWLPARFLGNEKRAGSVALLALVGAQLGQTLMLGGHSRWVWGATLGSCGALVAIVQTPGLSHFFGCRPLGPMGLVQAGSAIGAAMLLVPLGRRFAGEPGRWLEAATSLPGMSWLVQRYRDLEASISGPLLHPAVSARQTEA